jgi:hypothetical protein
MKYFSRKPPMAWFEVETRSHGSKLIRMIGDCIYADGSTFMVARTERVGKKGGKAELREVKNDGQYEMPEPIERFMERLKLVLR